MFDHAHSRNPFSYVLGYGIIEWYFFYFNLIPFVSCCREEPAFVFFALLHPLIRCQMLKAPNQLWLDFFQCVHACSVGEPRSRPSTPGVPHCAEQRKRFPPQTCWQLCLVQLRRLLDTFATGLQCWLMFSLFTRTLMFLFEKLLSS